MIEKPNLDRGQALVEFALIAIILFVLLFGIIEFGFILYDKAMVTRGSREGARAGAAFRVSSSTFGYSPLTEAEVRSAANSYLQNRLITFGAPFNAATDVITRWSTDGGATWIQALLPLYSTDSYHSDPAVDWTSDGTAWSLTMGVKGGVDALTLWKAVRQGAGGRRRTFDGLADQFLPGTFDPPAFALRLSHKDVSLAGGLARELGVPMRMANLALEELTEAMNRGWGERDSRVAMLLQEERAGVKIAVPVEQLKEVLEKDGR